LTTGCIDDERQFNTWFEVKLISVGCVQDSRRVP